MDTDNNTNPAAEPATDAVMPATDAPATEAAAPTEEAPAADQASA